MLKQYQLCNCVTSFPKLYTVTEDREAANTICNNDGGALAIVLTQDDRSAMDYYVNETDKPVWVGLKKIEDINCSNDTCDGKLRWQNGKQFVFDSQIHDAIVGDGIADSMCFRRRYNKQNYNDVKCHQTNHYLCQIACPGKSIL